MDENSNNRILRELVLCERVASSPFSCRDYLAKRLQTIRAPSRIAQSLRDIAQNNTDPHHMAVQLRALRKSLSGKTVCAAKQHLLDPAFNIHEIRKNAILFLDHLSTEDRYCPECLNKHALLMEAFADEALGLDTNGKWRSILLKVLPDILMLRKGLDDNRMDHEMRLLFLRSAATRVLNDLPKTTTSQ